MLPRQILYQLTLLARDPMGSFISVVIPLMLLIALDLVTPEMTLSSLHGVAVAQFLTPAMASFAVLNAGFVNIVIGMTLAREQGILTRFRPTPLPTWVYMSARVVAASIVALFSAATVITVGVVALHAHLALASLPGLFGVFALGLAASCALGLAASGIVPAAEAALPLAYAVLLPVAFISQVFFPAPTETAWLHHLADALPVAPFASALQAPFLGLPTGFSSTQLTVLIAWCVGGVLFAMATYQWRPGHRSLRQRRVRHHG
jgi:ABC-2 type transport system permease protein